ncbi:MAG: sigma-54 dependent transcriptional regulator [Mariprofundaceae bacterium]
MAEILLVEDEANARQVLALGLQASGHMVTDCSSPEEAKVLLSQKHGFDVVLTDLRMAGRDAGLDVVKMSAQLCPKARVLLLTAYASSETAVEAMRYGAFDYLTKPVSREELSSAVERALQAGQTDAPESGNQGPQHDAVDLGKSSLVGESPVMLRVKERLLRASKRDFTVLISGESGTGKELASCFLHQYSKRSKAAFVPVNCGAIPEGLFESELFGHCKGAFTGADRERIGLIESAHGGTLFLDEVGEMPLAIQVKLLRFLQGKSFRPVGSDKEKLSDVRVVAATNKDLSELVRQGLFREDLFYRLNVVPVHMPALRQRREDIPDLVKVLLGDEPVHMSATCMQRLMQLSLPGNVRELENLLQRLIALSDDGELDVSLLDDLEQRDIKLEFGLDDLRSSGEGLEQALERMERNLLAEALQKTAGNATQAAKLLGISFRSIRYRMKKLVMKGE